MQTKEELWNIWPLLLLFKFVAFQLEDFPVLPVWEKQELLKKVSLSGNWTKTLTHWHPKTVSFWWTTTPERQCKCVNEKIETGLVTFGPEISCLHPRLKTIPWWLESEVHSQLVGTQTCHWPDWINCISKLKSINQILTGKKRVK